MSDGEVYHCDIHGFEAESRGQMQQHIDHEHPGGAAKDTPEEFLRADGGVAQLKGLKCAPGPQTTAAVAYKEDKEAASVRYEDEKEISEGDHLSLDTEQGEQFATAKVTAVKEVYAWRAFPAIRSRGACYGPGSTGHLITQLNHHYDDTIWPSTRVKVIFFEVISFAE